MRQHDRRLTNQSDLLVALDRRIGRGGGGGDGGAVLLLEERRLHADIHLVSRYECTPSTPG